MRGGINDRKDWRSSWVNLVNLNSHPSYDSGETTVMNALWKNWDERVQVHPSLPRGSAPATTR